MEISYEQAKALQEWILLRVGYISYEFDPEVHKFIDKLFEYIKNEEEKDKDDSSETSERGTESRYRARSSRGYKGRFTVDRSATE